MARHQLRTPLGGRCVAGVTLAIQVRTRTPQQFVSMLLRKSRGGSHHGRPDEANACYASLPHSSGHLEPWIARWGSIRLLLLVCLILILGGQPLVSGSAARGGTSVEKVGRPYLADPLREMVRGNMCAISAISFRRGRLRALGERLSGGIMCAVRPSPTTPRTGCSR